MRHGGVDTSGDAKIRADVDADVDVGMRLRMGETHGNILHGTDTPGTAAHQMTPTPLARTVARCDSGRRSTRAEGT